MYVFLCASCVDAYIQPCVPFTQIIMTPGSIQRLACRHLNIHVYTHAHIHTYTHTHTHSHVLLGRKELWPKGQYSTLAGFTEISESLEETIVREIAEESGIKVRRDSIKYDSSQVCKNVYLCMHVCITVKISIIVSM